ncbi:MAG: ATP-binding protein [Janthinobacterium lividum]
MDGMGSPIRCNDFFDASLIPTALADAGTHIVRYANDAFCQLLGRPMDVIVGSTLAASIPRCEECLRLIDRVARTSEAETHVELRDSSPQEICWSYSAWPFGPAAAIQSRVLLQISAISEFKRQATEINQALMLSAVRQHELAETADALAAQMRIEIEERKRSQEALKTSEDRLMLALDSANASTWEWNVASKKLKLQGQNLHSPDGQYSHEASYQSWRSLVFRDDWPAVDGAAERMAENSGEISVEFRLGGKTDAVRWILARGRPTQGDNGEAVLYSGIVLDISERKHAEAMLLRSEKLASVGRLAATLAHEINNPLDAAINCIYIAKGDPNLPEGVRVFLEMADDELRRVTHMTRQSLGFYREATVPSKVSMNQVIESVVQLLSNRIAAKHVTVDLRLGLDPAVEGIFGELRQVFVNLVSNSLDAVQPYGKITLKSSVGVRSCASPQTVRVTVADNGKGMTPAQSVRIFEAFFTTKGELGTGLGLWVTKQIVEKHGGTVRVRSSTRSDRSGSVFSVALPYSTKNYD